MPRSNNRMVIAITIVIARSETIPWPAMAAAGTDELFLRVLAAPDDPVVNREFAIAAEARGDLRHALAALERARNARPDDREIAAEYERVRNKLLPTVTVVVAQVGMSVASNGRQLPSTSGRRHMDGILDGAVVVEDERTTSDMRLRSRIAVQGQQHWENTELTSGRIAVESGPVFHVNRDLWMHVAPGTAMAWLHEHRLFNDVSVAVSLGGVLGGLSQIGTVRYSWRRGNEEIQNADSHVFDLEGRFTANLSLIAGDILYLQPRWRLNQAIDPLPLTAVGQTVLGDYTSVARDISPWSYQEYGARGTVIEGFIAAGGHETFVLVEGAFSVTANNGSGGTQNTVDVRHPGAYVNVSPHTPLAPLAPMTDTMRGAMLQAAPTLNLVQDNRSDALHAGRDPLVRFRDVTQAISGAVAQPPPPPACVPSRFVSCP